MFGLVLTLAALGQAPEYVANYKPKVGDKVVLARDEAGRKVPVAGTDGAALGFKDIMDESDFNYEALLDSNDQLAEIAGGTPAQIIENVNYLREPIFFKVQILEGPFKGKMGYAYATTCRKLDPAVAKATAEARKKRGPLDKRAIANEVKDELAKAKPNEASKGLSDKKKIVRDTVNPICEKHKADFKEVYDIATGAGVLITLEGKKYDIAGNRVRK